MGSCMKCGKELNGDGTICSECESATAIVSPTPEKKNKKTLMITLIGILLMTVIVVIGFLTNWFRTKSPVQSVINAFENTLRAENLTVKADIDDNNHKVYLDWGRDGGDTILLAEGKYSSILYRDGEKYYYDREDPYYSYIDDVDSRVKDVIDDIAESSDGNIDYEKIVDDARLDDYVDSESIELFLKEFYKDFLCNEKWLKETLGFSKEKDTYTFRPDILELCEDMTDFCNNSAVFNSDAKDVIEDFFEDIVYYAKINDVEIVVEISVDRKYISEINAVLNYDGEEYTAKIEFEDINNTDAVSKAEKIEKQVKQWW